MIRRKEKIRARPPFKLSADLREYLAFIGGRGGEVSRRWLSKSHARQMVAIREAKRRAWKEGKFELASKRWPLPKEKAPRARPDPAVRSSRMIGSLGLLRG